MKNRIAYIYYPHSTNAARLETMPMALNSIVSMAKKGWNIDLFLWEKRTDLYMDMLPDNVNIRFLRDIRFNDNRVILLRQINFFFRFILRFQYRCVFGLGQIGAHIASVVAGSSKCPFVYINDEYPSQWFESRWGRLEKRAAARAALWVVPDKVRFDHLYEELEAKGAVEYAELPNMPVIKKPLEQVDWHQVMGLPENSTPFLHAGSLADWAQVPEILTSVQDWPNDAVLILHGRGGDEAQAYKNQLSHLDIPGKVFWSFEPMDESRLNDLVAYCSGSFGLYRNLGVNIEHMGYSSGKIMRSLVCGTPVIASEYDSLSFITTHDLGVQISHPSEIPDAVRKLKMDIQEYRERCLAFIEKEVSFEESWIRFCEKLHVLTGLDLGLSAR